MISKVILIGRITNDLIIESSKNGNDYCRFSVACSAVSQGAQKTSFFNCVCFGNTAVNLKNYCAKGSLIFIDGTITQNTYQNKQEITVRSYTIICNQIRFLQSSSRRSAGKSDKSKTSYLSDNKRPTSSPVEEGASNFTKTNSKKVPETQKLDDSSKKKASKDINFADDIDWGSE